MPQFDAYFIYCAHQRARNQPAPSREWWDMACKARPYKAAPVQDFDIETERREGWAYDR